MDEAIWKMEWGFWVDWQEPPFENGAARGGVEIPLYIQGNFVYSKSESASVFHHFVAEAGGTSDDKIFRVQHV